MDHPAGKLPVPRLATTAYTAKQLKKQKKTEEEKKEDKRIKDQRRGQSRINIGYAISRWRALRDSLGLTLDQELAIYLLDSFEKPTEASSAQKPDPVTSSPSSVPPHDQCPSCGFVLTRSGLQNGNSPNEENQSESIEVTLEGESEGSGANEQNRREACAAWSPAHFYTLTLSETKEPTAAADELGRRKKKKLCSECGAFYTKAPHGCEHKTRPFVCDICGKRCASEPALSVHSGVHSETRGHACTHCHAPFRTKRDRLEHEAVHGEQRDPFKCPDCAMTFASYRGRSEHLNNHWDRSRLRHTGQRAFKCWVCGRGFNREAHLRWHRRLHTGPRPHKCRLCDRAFNHKVSLTSHLQRGHPETDREDGETGVKAVF